MTASTLLAVFTHTHTHLECLRYTVLSVRYLVSRRQHTGRDLKRFRSPYDICKQHWHASKANSTTLFDFNPLSADFPTHYERRRVNLQWKYQFTFIIYHNAFIFKRFDGFYSDRRLTGINRRSKALSARAFLRLTLRAPYARYFLRRNKTLQ